MVEYPIVDEEIPCAAEPAAVYSHRRMAQHAPVVRQRPVSDDEKLQPDVDAYYDAHRAEIAAAYGRMKQTNSSRIPAGYHSLAEFDELFKRKISEAYAHV